jgi:MYXO-CTERM domain-containing protein
LRRCGQLAAELVATYLQGVSSAFHPAFLAHGLQPKTPTRLAHDPLAMVAGGCDGAGEAGLWMCKPNENSLANCQRDEFFVRADEALSALSGIQPLAFDYQPPLIQPTDLSVEPGNGSALLHWELPSSGDIAGFRVLCEEADGGAAPRRPFAPPDLTAEHRGTHYFTAGNLCGDQPFSTVHLEPAAVTDPNTCGNGVVEAGEACDDGEDNDPDGLCDRDCRLRVGPDLHALSWDHVCSDHVDFSDDSVVVGGLTNGSAYNFVLVAYDLAGNPRAFARVVTATPDASLPDLLPASDEGCGCATSPEGHGLFAMSLGTLFMMPRRRRR